MNVRKNKMQSQVETGMSEIKTVMGNITMGVGSHPYITGGVVFVSNLFLSIPAPSNKHSFFPNKVKKSLRLCRTPLIKGIIGLF